MTTEATTAAAAEPKKRGRKAGSTNRTVDEKGAALALVDFFGGSYKRAASATGIPARTLMNWREELEADDGKGMDIQSARIEGGEVIMEALRRFLEGMMAIALWKAAGASFKDIYYALGISFDKLERMMVVFNQQRQILNAQQSVLNAGAPTSPTNVEPVVPPDPRSQWESILDQIMRDAEGRGEPLTRDQAKEALIKLRPEAQGYLM